MLSKYIKIQAVMAMTSCLLNCRKRGFIIGLKMQGTGLSVGADFGAPLCQFGWVTIRRRWLWLVPFKSSKSSLATRCVLDQYCWVVWSVCSTEESEMVNWKKLEWCELGWHCVHVLYLVHVGNRSPPSSYRPCYNSIQTWTEVWSFETCFWCEPFKFTVVSLIIHKSFIDIVWAVVACRSLYVWNSKLGMWKPWSHKVVNCKPWLHYIHHSGVKNKI